MISVARRGLAHAAFSTKEIRELSSLPDLELYMLKNEVADSMGEEIIKELE